MQLEFLKKCKVNKGTVFLTSFARYTGGSDKRCSGFRGEPGRYYSCRIVRLCRREWIDLEMRRSRMDRQGIFERLHMKERDPGLHTYSDTRSGRGGGESRDFLRPSEEAIFFVM